MDRASETPAENTTCGWSREEGMRRGKAVFKGQGRSSYRDKGQWQGHVTRKARAEGSLGADSAVSSTTLYR